MTATPSSLAKDLRLGLFLLLGLVMVATRSHHFGALPDASWAVFFLAGFYLSAGKPQRPVRLAGSAFRWAFPLLMALAVAIDYAVIRSQGIDFWGHYCVSPAYWFLVPSYAALWFGGAWLRAHYRGVRLREGALLVASVMVAASLCYLISNGSFYWISPSVPARSFGGWIENLGDWYLPFMQTTLIYVGIGAALHVATTFAVAALGGAVPRSTQSHR
jgi:hypothetical protein